MRFRTEINLDKNSIQLFHGEKICTIGSCFAENIAEYFSFYRFNVLNNPFGVLYNPVSIYNSIKLLIDGKRFTKEDLFNDQGEWHSFYHHSDFSHHDFNICLKQINDGLDETRKFISDAGLLIITFGTGYVFKHTANDIVVSNCHKIPSKQFQRFRLTVEEVKKYINSTIELLGKLNNNLKIIFTVSPVRHWKDGAVDNQLSKSILLLAVNESIKEKNNCAYFPSYEIMMDDLRDYRFYENDLVHPNKIATDYIWDKFTTAHFSDGCENIIKDIEPIIKARRHRTRNIYSESNKMFVSNQLKRIDELEKKYPALNLKEDKEYFKKIIEEIDKHSR